MNYPMGVGPARRRPSLVTVAGYLLYLVAGLLAINVVAWAATFSTACCCAARPHERPRFDATPSR